MIYYLVFLIIFVAGFLEVLGANRQSKVFLTLLSLFIIGCLQSFRWETGTDWFPFWDFFVNSKTFDDYFSSDFEFGYAFFNYIVGILTRNYTFFLAIYSFIMMWLYRKAAIDNGSYLIIIILFMFCGAVLPVRQALSIAIVFYGYKYLIQRNFIPFLFVVLIATSIHRSAIIFFPSYFIVNYKFSSKVLLLSYILSVLIGLSGTMLTWMINIFLTYGLGVEGVLAEKLGAYLSGRAANEPISFVQFIFSLLSNVIWIFLFLYFRIKNTNKRYDILLNIYFMGLIINRMFVLAAPDFARLALFYSGSFILLIALILERIKLSNRIILYVIVSIYCFSQMKNQIHGKYEGLYNPYISVFSETKRKELFLE